MFDNQRLFRLLAANRQPNLEACFALLRLDSNIAVVPLDHGAIHNVQAKTCAFALRFGRKERLEDARLYLRRDARPIIDNLHKNAVVFA